MKRVKIYTTPTCPWCKRTKKFFKEKGIKYEEVDVSSNEEGVKEMVDISGQMGVPVIDIEGKIVVGFDQEAIEKELDLNK